MSQRGRVPWAESFHSDARTRRYEFGRTARSALLSWTNQHVIVCECSVPFTHSLKVCGKVLTLPSASDVSRFLSDWQALLIHRSRACSASFGGGVWEASKSANLLMAATTRSAETTSLTNRFMMPSMTAMWALWQNHKPIRDDPIG